MNCKEIDQNSTFYFSHELDPEQSAEFLAHLEACSSCAARVRQQQELDHLLRSTVLNQELDTRALEFRIRRELTSTPKRPIVFSRRWALVAAGLFLAAIVGLLSSNWLRATREASAICADAIVDHRVEVVENAPRKWSSDLARIASVSQKIVGAEVNPEQLAPSGYHFERARICSLQDKRYVHLVFSNGNQQMSMFVRARDNGAARALSWWNNRRLYQDILGNTNVVRFDGQKFSFVLVGEGNIPVSTLASEVAGRG
jgi:anti-sigma factor RsiW